MLIIVNTDTGPRAPRRLIGRVEATLRYRLARFSKRLARVEVCIIDARSADQAGGNRCLIQATAEGHAPVSVAEQGPIFELALAGATAKTEIALERTFATAAVWRSC